MKSTVRGGTIVSADGERRVDLVIEDGRITDIGPSLAEGPAIDAGGLLVLPGMVDTHVHLMDPGDTTREDFPTGTAAASAAGVTTIVEHTHSHPIRTTDDLAEKRAHVAGRANVDYGLAAHVWPDTVDQIGALSRDGVTFFKIFTCDTHGVPGLDSADMQRALTAVAGAGARCLIHNEDQAMTADAERRLRADDRVDPGLLIEWRSRSAELVAVAGTAASVLTTGATATFAHVSNPGSLDVIDAFRQLGGDIAAETCPQYFALDEGEVREHGTLRKFTPPARVRDEADRDAMFTALRAGRFSHFATDHAPATLGQKQAGDIWEAPFGLPGLDTTLPFLLDAALSGQMSLPMLVGMYATKPARRYGLDKGTLRVGGDADFVLVDPAGSWTVSDDDIISKAGWSPYSGRTFRGRVLATYLRGVEIARDRVSHELSSGRMIGPAISTPHTRS